MGSEWTIRESVAEDEDCLASMWLKSYAHSSDLQECGFPSRFRDDSPEHIRYWKIHQPIVTALLREATVRVACDPTRSTYKPGQPAVVYAWVCSSPSRVHWVAIKRSVARLGHEVTADLLADLLGDLALGKLFMTFDLMDMRMVEYLPEDWTRERGWLSALRSLSTRMLDHDDLFATVGAHVLDTRRSEWAPAGRAA